MAFRYDYFEKKREAVLRCVHEHQPVTLLQLTQYLAPTYSFQAIKNELKALIAESLVHRQRARKYEASRLAGGTGFYYSIPKQQEVQQ